MKIGAQFYTIRNQCQNLEDFAESLKKVADIGYKTVQISGVCPYEPEWLAQQLKQNDLQCVLTHTAPADITGKPAEVAKNHDVFGCDHVGLGYFAFDPSAEGYRVEDFVRQYKPAAEILHENGKYFMYHNHSHEFQKQDGKLVLERLAEEMPKELMGFTVDTYWVQVGGGDSAQWIENLSGRVPCIHLKDYAYGVKMAPIGEGNLNWNRIFAAAEAAGTHYMLVEQDDCYGEDPFDCLKRSYDFLRANGFE